jgi:hypothetical protein
MAISPIRAVDRMITNIIFKIFMLNRFLYEKANQTNIHEMMIEI